MKVVTKPLRREGRDEKVKYNFGGSETNYSEGMLKDVFVKTCGYVHIVSPVISYRF